MKRAWPFILLFVGVLVWFSGLIYDVAFAGIPYQDPTPELAEDFAFHSQIATAICWSGFGVFIFGLVAVALRLILKKEKQG